MTLDWRLAPKKCISQPCRVGQEFAIVGSDAAAATSSALIVYSSGSGSLFYNQNASLTGFGTGAQFATLTGIPVISASDFVISV